MCSGKFHGGSKRDTAWCRNNGFREEGGREIMAGEGGVLAALLGVAGRRAEEEKPRQHKLQWISRCGGDGENDRYARFYLLHMEWQIWNEDFENFTSVCVEFKEPITSVENDGESSMAPFRNVIFFSLISPSLISPVKSKSEYVFTCKHSKLSAVVTTHIITKGF